MPRMPPEIKSMFGLEEVIRIQALQIELEKYRSTKLNNLASKAKNDKELRKAKVCYRAWSFRMTLVWSLQKQHKKLLKELEKQNKNVVSLNKPLAKAKGKAKAKAKTKTKAKNLELVNNELKQVC